MHRLPLLDTMENKLPSKQGGNIGVSSPVTSNNDFVIICREKSIIAHPEEMAVSAAPGGRISPCPYMVLQKTQPASFMYLMTCTICKRLHS